MSIRDKNMPDETDNPRRKALSVIILFGLVSLFGDIVYEGARSVNGPYLELLAANAVIVGLIAGAGEFIGYALRLISGYISDRTKSYWLLTFLGYGVLISVPLLSLAGIWQVAAFLIIIERIGKAIRNPARDTILSQASSQVGTGFGFGLHEAMDQIGAVAGPLIFTAFFILLKTRHAGIADYQKGYSLLWIPFLLIILCLVISYRKVPKPDTLEIAARSGSVPNKLSRVFWLYTLFTFIASAGFCNFLLIAFHFKLRDIISDAQIPLFYAVAMLIDAIAALAIGKMYDLSKARNNNRNGGLNLLVIIPVFSVFMAIFVFSGNMAFIIAGVCFWGVVMGIHETIMRSAIADITPLEKRGTGYGLFNATYGLGVFLGSFLLGFLYDRSIYLLLIAVAIIEILALTIFFFMKGELRKNVQ